MLAVGNEYSRPLGSNKQYVTITKICDDGTVEAISKSGKQRFHTKISNVDKWTLIKQADVQTNKVERVYQSAPERVTTKKRLNSRPFVEVLIDTICSSNTPMNARQLVDKVKSDGSYIFKDGIKTPWNSASSRLNAYMHDAGENSKIKFVSRGVFAKK